MRKCVGVWSEGLRNEEGMEEGVEEGVRSDHEYVRETSVT